MFTPFIDVNDLKSALNFSTILNKPVMVWVKVVQKINFIPKNETKMNELDKLYISKSPMLY